jgi:hypothetical protein
MINFKDQEELKVEITSNESQIGMLIFLILFI